MNAPDRLAGADDLVVGNRRFRSRLLVVTGKYKDFGQTREAIAASDAAIAMELGCAGVLMKPAIAQARDPVRMARAMRRAVEAGREAFLAGGVPRKLCAGAPSSPTGGLIA